MNIEIHFPGGPITLTDRTQTEADALRAGLELTTAVFTIPTDKGLVYLPARSVTFLRVTNGDPR